MADSVYYSQSQSAVLGIQPDTHSKRNSQWLDHRDRSGVACYRASASASKKLDTFNMCSKGGLTMNRAAAVSFATLLGSIALAAQSPDQKQATTLIIRMPAENTACPVAMQARQGVNGDLRAVKNSRPEGTAQLIHLILTNRDARQITGGAVTVHGLTGKGRVTKTPSAGDDSSEAMQNLSVKFSAGADKDVFADLWVPGMTSVHAIELHSVTYTDGSTWKLPMGTACRIVPDPLMRVSEK